MDRYKTIKIKHGWLGIFQTSFNYQNIIRIGWQFPLGPMHRDTDFYFWILKFGMSLSNHHKYLKRWELRILGLRFTFCTEKNNRWFRFENYHLWKSLRKAQSDLPF